MPNAIESERLLLVEGNDHRNFFEAFRDHLAIPEMQIENYGGVSQLSGFFEFLRRTQARKIPWSACWSMTAGEGVESSFGFAEVKPLTDVLLTEVRAELGSRLPDDGPGMLETVLARCPPPRS